MPKTLCGLLLAAALCLAGCQRDHGTAAGSGTTNNRPRTLDGGEVILASNPDQSGQAYLNQSVTDKLWVAWTFTPDQPCKVTSATVRIGKLSGAMGSVAWNVYVRKCDAGHKPVGGTTWSIGYPDTYASAQIAAADIPVITSGTTQPPTYTVTFTNGKDIPAGQEVALVIAPPPFSPYGYAGLASGGTSTPTETYYVQCNVVGGTVWGTPQTNRDFASVEVKGTTTTP